MPTIRVTCPTCNETLELDDRYIGQEVECGSCFQTFVAERPSSRRRPRDDDEEEEDRRPRRRRPRDDDDDDYDYDRPRRRSSAEGGNTAATWSLVLGLLSIPCACCGLFSLPVSIGAIATGATGMKKEEGKGLAVTGMILGIVGVILAIISVIIGMGMQMNNPGQFKGVGGR